MKKHEVTPEFIDSIKPKVEKAARRVLVFTHLTFVENTYFNTTGEDSNYITFAAWSEFYKKPNSVTYDVEYDAIDINTHRISAK